MLNKPSDLFAENIYINNFYELNEKMQAEMKKEEEKRNKGVLINTLKELIKVKESEIYKEASAQLMNVKKKFGKDNVFPLMREYEDKQEGYKNTRPHLNYFLSTMGKELGIETKISNHQARHIFAQRLFESGANFHHISMALGHSSLQITENYREQLITDESKELSEVFVQTFSGKDWLR